MKVYCTHCHHDVEANLIRHFDSTVIEGIQYKYGFHKCPRCQSPLLVQRSRQKGMGPRINQVTLFPLEPFKVDAAFPAAVKHDYEETVKCFQANAYTATAIMCRKMLECILEEKKVVGRNLSEKLSRAKEDKVIDATLLQWANMLRLVGNEAVHGIAATFTKEDAEDALTFIRAILEYIYTYRSKFDQFLARRKQELRKH